MGRTVRCVRAAVGSVAFLLAACGGGGADPPAPTPVAGGPEITIAAFAPAHGEVGASVEVTGSALDRVTSAHIGGVAAVFSVHSDSTMRLTVPVGAQSGPIELAGGGRVIRSAADFVVMRIPDVASVQPASLFVPGRLTISGTDLDLVTQARLNDRLLTIASQSQTALELDVPNGVATGYVVLLSSDGTARQVAQPTVVLEPLRIDTIAPTTVARGLALSITGSALDRAQVVRFANGAHGAIAARSAATQITVTVPSDAVSGAVTILGDRGDSATSGQSVTVVARIVVDGTGSRIVAAGETITLSGSGFEEVARVMVGAVEAAIVDRGDTHLSFAVPAGVACGDITLTSPSQPAVPAGRLVVGAGCTLRFEGTEVAQVLAQPSTDPYQRLVPGKETLVRAFVVAETEGVASPPVHVVGFNGASTLGSVPMTGPPTVPVLAAGAPLSDALRYEASRTFNATLPAEWVQDGLRVRIEVDSGQRDGDAIATEIVPRIGTATRLDVIVVPLVSASFVPTVPPVQEVLDELIRRLPVRADRITVAVRAPYTLTSVTDGLDTSGEWSAALKELYELARSEAPDKHYYGIVRPAGGSIAGIGYIGAPAAVGWDSGTGWRRTMTHELGHNFNRRHAPCGAVSGADASYPYSGGAMSATALFDSIADEIFAPTGYADGTDVMGYCGGSWFSDYNYREVQRFLEAQPRADAAVASALGETSLIAVSGTLGADGVAWSPVRASRGVAPAGSNGEYRLRLRTRAGTDVEVPFDAFEVDHADPPQRHFHVVMPDPGPLASVEVRRGDAAIPARGGERVAAAAAPGAPAVQAIVGWREVGSRLELGWNAATHPFASVTHVGGGKRTVLALGLRGGRAKVDLTGLPRGGRFELSLSDGLNAELITLSR